MVIVIIINSIILGFFDLYVWRFFAFGHMKFGEMKFTIIQLIVSLG